MNEKTIKIGSITILVILPKELDHQLTEEEISYVESCVKEEFQSRIDKSWLQGAIKVGNTSSEYGCLVVTIEILVILSALYKFIKDYPKLRDSAIAIAKDIQRLRLKLRGKEYSQGNIVRDSDFEIEEAVKEAIKQLEENDR
ncbi:hypothetical protein [Vreelandella salicampi]|jgi:hypothetical protein|uniref:Uncharacterized protein n=1 Tax=Vreelandella salicampi TaxID=1449798 RepID=A0A7Z0LP37_9GAMM|nr:hypothetical protein [Halomonas salicampi]NYS62465.1 hypothetical protein [Halomonas salicampi]